MHSSTKLNRRATAPVLKPCQVKMRRRRKRGAGFLLKPCTTTTTRKAKARQIVGRHHVDRISGLPDELLVQILSLLPTKDAVATSVLSRRWRRVYTGVTSLDFDDSPICHCSRSPNLVERFDTYKAFVDIVLEACRSPHTNTNTSTTTTKFSLKCGREGNILHRPLGLCEEACFPYLESTRFNEWICFPLVRGVRELDLCLHVRKPPGKLPGALFTCQTLEILKLDMNVVFEIPGLLCLPNLKVFHVNSHRIYEVGDIVARLLSGCPYLEDLTVKGYCRRNVDVVNVSSFSLKRLNLEIPNEDCSPKSHLVLNAPNLQYLEYLDHIAPQYTVGSLDCLADAHISPLLHNSLDSEIGCQTMYSLVRNFFNIERLSLDAESVELLQNDPELMETLPMFHNLKNLRLSFSPYCEWHKVLLELLNHSPNLETIDFPWGLSAYGCLRNNKSVIKIGEVEVQYWSSVQAIPSCFLFHLKKITIKQYGGLLEQELAMLKYFLRNALVLEELVIVCHDSVTLADRVSLSSKLYNLSRGSTTCSIDII